MDFGEDIGLELTTKHVKNIIFIEQVIFFSFFFFFYRKETP